MSKYLILGLLLFTVELASAQSFCKNLMSIVDDRTENFINTRDSLISKGGFGQTEEYHGTVSIMDANARIGLSKNIPATYTLTIDLSSESNPQLEFLRINDKIKGCLSKYWPDKLLGKEVIVGPPGQTFRSPENKNPECFDVSTMFWANDTLMYIKVVNCLD